MVVDVQEPLPIPDGLVQRIERFARRFTLRVFTLFVNQPESPAPHMPELGRASKRVKLRLKPRPGDMVIRKSGYGLAAAAIRRLKSAGVKRASVCGVETDACVMGVMFSLLDNGIEPELVERLCWSSSRHEAAARKILRLHFPGAKRKGRRK